MVGGFVWVLILSVAMVSHYSVAFHVRYHDAFSSSAATALLLTACIAPAFQFAKFSFGYFVSFYLFTMMAGYFWLNRFSELNYDHRTALISAIVSIVLFLIPAPLIRPQTNRATTIPLKTFNHLPACILAFSIFALAISSLSGFHFVGLSEMYEYRAALAHPRAVQYVLGNISGALIPFAFACLLAKRRWLMLLALFSLSAIYYPVTMTKVSLFLPFYLVFITLLSTMFEARISAVLSLF